MTAPDPKPSIQERLEALKTAAAHEVRALEDRLREIVTRYEEARQDCEPLPGLIQSPLLDDVATAYNARRGGLTQ